MKKFQRFEGSKARRVKPPRKPELKWEIREEGEAWVADSGTGVRVWADAREKLVRWIRAEK